MHSTNATTTYTAGPWIVTNHNEICADNEHESFIAEVFDESDHWRANARLIAAAPELLDALKYVAAQNPINVPVNVIERAKTAIAEAERVPRSGD